jgi:phage terminase large subunit-like protein
MDRYFFAIYSIDETDDPTNPAVWAKANPNLGVSVDMELLNARFEYSKSSASDMTTFKTKNLNVWCHSLARWANMQIWTEKCTSASHYWLKFDNSLDGRLCYGGLDLSSNSDFTAITLDFPMEEGKHVQLTHCWIADDMKDTIARQCRIPLERWIQAGWVTATPGATIDYEYVREYLTDAYSRYQLEYIAADRWKIEELVRIMPPWFVDVAYEFSQGLKTMSPSIKQFERAYLEGNVYALDNECVSWMMSCAEIFQDTTGNIKLVKPKRRTEARIDGVITSVMALDCAIKHDAEPVGDVSNLISFF